MGSQLVSSSLLRYDDFVDVDGGQFIFLNVAQNGRGDLRSSSQVCTVVKLAFHYYSGLSWWPEGSLGGSSLYIYCFYSIE